MKNFLNHNQSDYKDMTREYAEISSQMESINEELAMQKRIARVLKRRRGSKMSSYYVEI